MEAWDSEGADGNSRLVPSLKQKKWEGEDEEDEVKDSWDQDPEEEEKQEPRPASPSKTSKGKKYEEKEKKRKKDLRYDEPTETKPMTPEEIQAEKLRRRKLEEEADLEVAKEVFGGGGLLESKEDFDKFKDEILNKISDSTKNSYFVSFTEELVHCLCLHLSSADLKKIHSWVGNLHIEKSKIEKGEKSKKSKGKGKVKLKMEGNNDFSSEYSAYTEDYDDIM